jgi:SAM-dependent methyltransferase
MEQIITRLKRPLELLLSRVSGNQICYACGFKGKQKSKKVLWANLINEWELTSQWVDWYNDREGRYCVNCYCSARANQLALSIIEVIKTFTGTNNESLAKAFDKNEVKLLSIAEINSAGTLHQYLSKSPNLIYSEYASKNEGIPSENLLELSYQSNMFDIVITSETLEHVPDFDVSIKEIYRVLKPGGIHVFTIPVVWDRPHTKQRTKIENGQLVYIFPPSYHGSKYENQSDYLVFYEFGLDVIQRCEKAGFKVELIRDKNNPALVSFITRKN